jgi:hypothetical protein
MQDRNIELYGMFEVPVTESLRGKFDKITNQFRSSQKEVTPKAQSDLQKLCSSPQDRLELLSHLIKLGMHVPSINAEIRLSSDTAQRISIRVNSGSRGMQVVSAASRQPVA